MVGSDGRGKIAVEIPDQLISIAYNDSIYYSPARGIIIYD